MPVACQSVTRLGVQTWACARRREGSSTWRAGLWWIKPCRIALLSAARSVVRMCANVVGVCGWPNRLVSCATVAKKAVNCRAVSSASRIVPRWGMRNRSMYCLYDSRVVGRMPTRVDSQYRSHRWSVHAWLV